MKGKCKKEGCRHQDININDWGLKSILKCNLEFYDFYLPGKKKKKESTAWILLAWASHKQANFSNNTYTF